MGDEEFGPPPDWSVGIAAELAAGRNSAARQWEVLAGIDLTLGSMSKALQALARQERRMKREREADMPVFWDFAQSGTVPASGVMVLKCGGPARGRLWHVKRLVVGGLTLATTAAGTAEAYSTGYISDLAGIPSSLSDIHDATILISSPQTPLPNIGNYEDGQFTVSNGEHLFVVFRGATSGQEYVAAGTVKDLRVSPHEVVEAEG